MEWQVLARVDDDAVAGSPDHEQAFVDWLEGDQESDDEDEVEAEDESIEGVRRRLDHEEGHVHDTHGDDEELGEGFGVVVDPPGEDLSGLHFLKKMLEVKRKSKS